MPWSMTENLVVLYGQLIGGNTNVESIRAAPTLPLDLSLFGGAIIGYYFKGRAPLGQVRILQESAITFFNSISQFSSTEVGTIMR